MRDKSKDVKFLQKFVLSGRTVGLKKRQQFLAIQDGDSYAFSTHFRRSYLAQFGRIVNEWCQFFEIQDGGARHFEMLTANIYEQWIYSS